MLWMTSLIKRMKDDTFWWNLDIRGRWRCVCVTKKVRLEKKKEIFFPPSSTEEFNFKAFLFVTSQQKALIVTKYAEKTNVFFLFFLSFFFFRGKGARERVDSWASLLVFAFVFKNLSSAVWWRQSTVSLVGNDSIPHTSRLSLQICKSCLICPKQSQEETTVLMPLKSGH